MGMEKRYSFDQASFSLGAKKQEYKYNKMKPFAAMLGSEMVCLMQGLFRKSVFCSSAKWPQSNYRPRTVPMAST